jgi:type IV secretion system protein VirB1
MILDPATVLSLADRCAPAAAAETLLAVAQAESRLDPYAVGVNHGAPPARRPQSRAEAVTLAKALLAAGANIDLGLTQINSANLGRLGLSVEDAFDPCRSLASAAAVLQAAYGQARAVIADPQAALRTAFSLYNTGDRSRGFRNGYVTRVLSAAARRQGAAAESQPSDDAPRATAAWDVFGDLRPAAFTLRFPSTAPGASP